MFFGLIFRIPGNQTSKQWRPPRGSWAGCSSSCAPVRGLGASRSTKSTSPCQYLPSRYLSRASFRIRPGFKRFNANVFEYSIHMNMNVSVCFVFSLQFLPFSPQRYSPRTHTHKRTQLQGLVHQKIGVPAPFQSLEVMDRSGSAEN